MLRKSQNTSDCFVIVTQISNSGKKTIRSHKCKENEEKTPEATCLKAVTTSNKHFFKKVQRETSLAFFSVKIVLL